MQGVAPAGLRGILPVKIVIYFFESLYITLRRKRFKQYIIKIPTSHRSVRVTTGKKEACEPRAKFGYEFINSKPAALRTVFRVVSVSACLSVCLCMCLSHGIIACVWGGPMGLFVICLVANATSDNAR